MTFILSSSMYAVIYRIETLEHSKVSVFSHTGEFTRDMSEF